MPMRPSGFQPRILGLFLCLCLVGPGLAFARAGDDPAPTVEPAVPGAIAVENRLDEPFVLIVGDKEQGTVSPGESRLLSGIAAGPVTVLVRCVSGREMAQPFTIAPGATHTWVVETGRGQAVVRNLVGEAVQLYVDGVETFRLEPLASARFPLDPGDHRVTGACITTGHSETTALTIRGGDVVEVALGPQGGRILVENRTPGTVSTFRNGFPLAVLKPGQSVELGAQPLGRSLVEAVDGNGRVLLRRHFDVAAAGGERAHAVVGETNVRVLLRNETGEPLRVDPDVQAEPREIPAGAEGTILIAGEVAQIKLIGVETDTRYDQAVRAVPGQVLHLTVASAAGGLVLANATDRELSVTVDGKPVTSLAPGERKLQRSVPPGRHALAAMAGSEELDAAMCELARASWFTWRITGKTGEARIVNRSREDVRLLRDGAEAGTLPAGCETTWKDLPGRTLAVTAVGLESRRRQVFSLVPVGEKPALLSIEPASASFRVLGLDGRAALVLVDDVEVLAIPEKTLEPPVVHTTPGEHAVVAAFPDGSAFARLVNLAAGTSADLSVGLDAPGVEVRNRTGSTLTVWLDDRSVTSLPDGQDVRVELDAAGQHSLKACAADGSREWRLERIWFRQSGRFGWTLEE